MAFDLQVDDDGIPFSDYGVYGGIPIGRQRSILSVAERGLWYWNTFGLGDHQDRALLSYDWNRFPKNRSRNPIDKASAQRMLLHCAQWLVENTRQCGNFRVWEYPYPMSYGVRSGWRSAHTQAAGMQLLARVHELTGDPAYALPLPELLHAFHVTVAAGGLLDVADDGSIWYEKFADSGSQKPKVLNGMMFAILGLHDIATRTENIVAARLARDGLDAVSASLDRYDLGDWSAYDVFGKPASSHYHAIHIRQLSLLYSLYGDSRLEIFRLRFERYQLAKEAGAPSEGRSGRDH